MNRDFTDFPHAVLHVDGDAFFVSCEMARRPDLRGRAVVTGEERGIATAMNQAAKAVGVTRGMRTRDIRSMHPSVVILSSDYGMYRLYARRMYEIVRRYADTVEEYSIDECFALLRPSSTRRSGGHASLSYEDTARAIQQDLHQSLGITFSVGLGVNKVTAKIASKWNKPAGLTVMPLSSITTFLRDLPIGKVWGIGSSTTIYLRKLGITTALDLATKSREWVAEHCDKPLAEIYEEFQGKFVKDFEPAERLPSSIQDTGTFYPPTSDRTFLWSQLSCHVEDACARLRSQGLMALRASFFLKTQSFQYSREEVALPELLAEPDAILGAIRPHFDALYRGGLIYRATGISLSGLRTPESVTPSLFAVPQNVTASRIVHQAVDRVSRRFGKHAIFLGSSFKALKAEGERRGRGKRELNIIYLGRVG